MQIERFLQNRIPDNSFYARWARPHYLSFTSDPLFGRKDQDTRIESLTESGLIINPIGRLGEYGDGKRRKKK